MLDESAKIDAAISEEERSASQLPKMSGYRILLALPEVKATYESGLIKAGDTMHYEQLSSVIGFVMDMGPDCYLDKVKFPTGPYCRIGDFVLVGAYKGVRIKIHGKEMRICNDDEVLGVTLDPRGYARAGG